MGDQPIQRRLVAILAADVAGYTRLMERDTDGTVAAWQAARQEVIKPTVAGHSGKRILLRLYSSTGNQVLEYSLSKIRIPVVIAHHRKDSCSKTPPGNVEDLVDALKNAKILDVLWYEGGKPQGDECQAYHYHGFMGIELQVVNDIARAIKTTILGAR